MSRRSIQLTDELYDYMLEVSLREPALLSRLRDETKKLEMARMQISPEQGQFMALLARLIGARRTLDIGVFTGYSALSVALALPEDGRVVACDMNEAWTNIARRYWREAGVDHKIDLRLGPAADTLEAMLSAGRAGSYDFVFIDADKSGYDGYYEQSLRLLRPGGLIVIDNVLAGGTVLRPAEQSPHATPIRLLNEKILGDDRVDVSMLPVSDGLTLVRKR